MGEDVRAEMRWAWGHYRERAFGKDEIKPISGGVRSFPLEDHHLGLTLIEALDTLWLMELDAEFAEGLAWVKDHLDFDVDGELSVFETAIRLVGGLLSAWHACGDAVLLARARDLADRLLPSFDASPIGIPHRYINLRTGALRGPETNPAETGTFLPEFGLLSPPPATIAIAPPPSARSFRCSAPLADRAARRQDRRDTRIAQLPRHDRAALDSFYEYLWDG